MEVTTEHLNVSYICVSMRLCQSLCQLLMFDEHNPRNMLERV